MRRAKRLLAAACVLGLLSLDAASAGASRRVLVIGLDGASWNVIEPLRRAGRLPAIDGLVRRGARGTLSMTGPLISPALWTTFATGVPPARHGIVDFQVDGRWLTSANRRVPAVWNIASAAGRTVCVVGYHKTFPVERVRGVMVSNRFPEAEGSDSVFPRDALSGYRPAPIDVPARFTSFRFRPDYRERGAAAPDYRDQFLFDERLRRIYPVDEGFVRALEHLLRGRRFDLTIAYLRGIDYVSHGFWSFMDGDGSPEERAWFGQVIPRYYEYADEAIGRLTRLAGPDTTVIVLSDHGFGRRTPPPSQGPPLSWLSGEHSPDAILIAAGPGVEASTAAVHASDLDVLPTILAWLGLPAARDMQGAPIRALLDPSAPVLPRIATYGPAARAAAPAGPPVDEEARERLRSLGYLR